MRSVLPHRKNQEGQILLIIVLIMVVGLTVGLSLAARSIITLRNTTDEANSQKAFSAAEAGIEQVLKTGQAIQTALPLGNSVTIDSATIQAIAGKTSYLPNNGNPIFRDDGFDVWLSDYATDSAKIYQNQWSGTLNVYFGSASDNCAATPPQAPSIEIIVISGNRSAPLFSRYAVDPCASRRSSNNFSAPTAGSFTVQNATFPYRVAVTIPALTPGLVARIIPFYQSTPMGISVGNGDPPLPTQGNIITATGIAGTTQRKIVFYQGFDEIPAEFFYTLFSPK